MEHFSQDHTHSGKDCVVRDTCGSKTIGRSPAVVRASGALTMSMERCNSCVFLLQGTLGKFVAFCYKT